MTSTSEDATASDPWHAALARVRSLAAASPDPRTLVDDPRRAQHLLLRGARLSVDCTRQAIGEDGLVALGELIAAADVAAARDAMLHGEAVNATEARPAMHVQLRAAAVAGARPGAVVPGALPAAPAAFAHEAAATLARMGDIAEEIRAGRRLGATGEAIRAVVHVGIGGSGLGPELLVRALAGFGQPGLTVRFVANVDPDATRDALVGLRPAQTLVVIASKSWTTQETSVNAQAVFDWMRAAGLDSAALASNRIAVTARADLAAADGYPPEAILPFDASIGGRYSVWSAVGLPVAIAIGHERFVDLLAGAHAMDAHFATAPWPRNLPMLLGALDIWNRLRGATTLCVVPYASRLARLPAYLQQLVMESNGKGVTRAGQAAEIPAAPVVWGEPGTDAQHSFFQLLHQGLEPQPLDLLAVLPSGPPDARGRDALLLAHCIAQSAALLRGRDAATIRAELVEGGMPIDDADAAAVHRVHPGGRAHTLMTLDALDAATLGELLALFEHRTFVAAAIARINPFDQFGVELGKRIAKGVERALEGDADAMAQLDAGQRALVQRIRERRAASGEALPGAAPRLSSPGAPP